MGRFRDEMRATWRHHRGLDTPEHDPPTLDGFRPVTPRKRWEQTCLHGHLTCWRCGAMVANKHARARHIEWHLALDQALGLMPVDAELVPEGE